MRKAQELERPLSIGILLVLLRGDAPSMDALAASVGKRGKGTIIARLDELIDEGLVVDEIEAAFPHKRTIRLTEKGREVAEHLQAIGAERAARQQRRAGPPAHASAAGGGTGRR